MCLRVASSVTALAPFSQNSAVCRCSGEGSGQAQPWQSKPSTWLSLSRAFVARRTPICSIARFMVTATAVGPAAWSLACPTLEIALVDVAAGGLAAHGAILARDTHQGTQALAARVRMVRPGPVMCPE